MKIFLLSRYTSLGASSRLRSYQYLDCFQQKGWDIDVSPLFDDGYLDALYQKKVKFQYTVAGYFLRILSLIRKNQYDLLWFEKELLPFLPFFVEAGFIGKQIPYLVDYDDAIFHRYDQHPNGLVRRLLRNKIDRVMQGAALVTAGNRYLADRASTAGARQILNLPTVVDLSKYSVKNHQRKKTVTVGWIGSPATSHYLYRIGEVIQSLTVPGKLRFVAIGANPEDFLGIPLETWKWFEAEENQLLMKCDIGIMPLDDSPWERGKCGYKLIQYMASGLPVVASPVGVNTEIVQDGENGFLAACNQDWRTYILKLAEDHTLRSEMGKKGRKQIEDWYCLKVQAPRFAAAVENILQRAKTL